MTNQHQILNDEALLDPIDTASSDQDSALRLYAGGSDNGAYPKVPDFDPHLHVMLMNAYWRQVEACPEQASPIALSAMESPEAYFTPESWLEYRKV